MEKKLIKKDEFNISKWSGGSTTEMAIFPHEAKYLERDFIWRLSSATVEREESSFTKLPDFNRILLVLEGEAVLAHGQERSVSLGTYQQDSFDGAVKTKCFGKIRDYNLMYRKGTEGSMEVFDAEEEARPLDLKTDVQYGNISLGLYCTAGYIIASYRGEQTMVREGEQLVINDEGKYGSSIRVMGNGKGVFTQVYYDMDAFVTEEIPEEKASFDDYKAALKLTLFRNKWSRALQSGSGGGVWYDRALQKKLKFMDKSNINLILWIIGVIVSIALLFGKISTNGIMGIIIGWSIVMLFIISPLVYIILLPKPIKAHIKPVNKLTELEKKLFEEDDTNAQNVSKLMGKYKSSDDDDFLRKGESRFKRLFK